MDARRRSIFGAGSIGAFALMVVWTSNASAYPTYRNSASPGTDDCYQCHGDFRTSPYVSAHDGTSWGDDLHDVHRNTMLGTDANRCNICHSSGSRVPVYLNQSVGTAGFDAISCIGCHGRQADRGARPTDCADAAATNGPCGDGAGLRQHHWNAGETVCGNCHGDANPAGFRPVGENVKPPYYFTPDVLHPTKPTDPCNPPPSFLGENFKGSTLGLDGDGDSVYDTADTDCAPPATTPTATSVATPTQRPTATRTAVPTVTPVATQTAVRTATPIATATAASTATPVATQTAARTATPVATATAAPTLTPGATQTALRTATPVATATAASTATPVATQTAARTATPVATTTAAPTLTATAASTPLATSTATRTPTPPASTATESGTVTPTPIVAPTPTAAPKSNCDAGKIQCIDKKQACLLTVNGKAAEHGVPADVDQLRKCTAEFDGGASGVGAGCIGKLERKQDPRKPETTCTVTGDVTVLEEKVDAFVGVVKETVAAPTEPNGCEAGKTRCVSKLTSCLLRVHQDAARKGKVVDGTAIEKCTDHFDGGPDKSAKSCIGKLEANSESRRSKTPCSHTADLGILADEVDAFVADVVSSIRSATPGPTQTTVPTATATAVPATTPVGTATATPRAVPTHTAPAPTPTTDTVVICHEHEKTIQVSADTVSVHLAHGDTLGPCAPDDDHGED